MKDSNREMAEEIDRQVAEGTEFEGLVQVPGRVARNLSVVYSVRLSPEELRRFSEAAGSRGMTLSDFLRAAAEGAIHNGGDLMRAAAIRKVRRKVQELNEAVSQLG
jgi:hypothetical protein